MTNTQKMNKIGPMLEVSGFKGGFLQTLRHGIELQLKQLKELFNYDEADGDEKLEMDFMINDAKELYIKRMGERQERIMSELALVYDELFSESEIDELIELYSSKVWKKVTLMQPVMMTKISEIMVSHVNVVVAEVMRVINEKERKRLAVRKAKQAYRDAKQFYFANNAEALRIYEAKYKEVMERGY